jgi:pimeloyl-ACP methyl ester carboxylesterase
VILCELIEGTLVRRAVTQKDTQGVVQQNCPAAPRDTLSPCTTSRAWNMRLELGASRRLTLQRACLAAAAVLSPQLPASAWCGEKYPSWAYFLKWDETSVPFEWDGQKGEVYCRVVGDKRRESNTGVPPVLLVGNPGMGYDYLENLEALTVSDRRVIEIAFAGTRGDVPASMRSVGACAAQLEAVCRKLQLPAAHVLAHGLGAAPALKLLGDGQTPRVALRSLTLVSPYGTLEDLRPAARPPEGVAAFVLPTTDPKAPASCIADATASTNAKLWLGAGEVGRERLGGEALVRALQPAAALKVATLVAWGGEGAPEPLCRPPLPHPHRLLTPAVPPAADVVEPSWDATALQQSNVNLRQYSSSGHLPFIEQSEGFLTEYLDFLDAADGVKTSRELIIDPPSLKSIQSKSI